MVVVPVLIAVEERILTVAFDRNLSPQPLAVTPISKKKPLMH